jgi:hypothetical protein
MNVAFVKVLTTEGEEHWACIDDVLSIPDSNGTINVTS